MTRAGRQRAVLGAVGAWLALVPLASGAVTTPGPQATITGGPSGTVDSSDATFSFTADEADVTFLCALDGGGWSDCSSPQAYSGLADGGHEFRVRAVDSGGRKGPPDHRSWTVQTARPDTAAPDTAITAAPGSTTPSASATFAFSASEAGASFECSLDGGGFGGCGSPTTYDGLAAGGHSFEVRARDGAGNADETPATHAWTIVPAVGDALPPVVTVPPNALVEAQGPTGSPVPYAAATAVDPPGNVAVPVTCSPPSGSLFAQGATTVVCHATDIAGNLGTGTFTVTVQDTLPPVLTVPGAVTVGAETPLGASQGNAAIAGFLAQATALDVADPAPVVTHDAPAVFPPGDTTVTFRAVDRSGNAASRAGVVRVLPLSSSGSAGAPAAGSSSAAPASPTASPAAADLQPPDDVRNVVATAGNRVVTLRWRPPDDDDFGRVVVTRSERTSDAKEVYRGTATSFADRRVQNGVPYRYLVVAYDRAGNRSSGVPAVAIPRSPALTHPPAGAQVSAPPRLTWQATPGARYYNVQLFRGSTKVLSAWPRQPRLQLYRTWRYLGEMQRLTAGEYRWYVWPGVGPPAKGRYGRLVGDSRFVVR